MIENVSKEDFYEVLLRIAKALERMAYGDPPAFFEHDTTAFSIAEELGFIKKELEEIEKNVDR